MELKDFSNTRISASEWPEAWLMQEEEAQAKDLGVPNVPVPVDVLRDLGISYFKVGCDAFACPPPVINADWDNSSDSETETISRPQHRLSYANIITLRPDHFPEYPINDVKTAFKESCLHRKDELSYVLVGSGFLDVRLSASGDNGRWVRLHVKKGDMITIKEDLYHRFTADEREYKGVVKYFAGQPFWTPLVRIMFDTKIASN